MNRKIKTTLSVLLTIAILCSIVIISPINANAGTKKTYLDTMVYSDFSTELPDNYFSAYSGEDAHGNKCTRAIKYYINADWDDYSKVIQEKGETSISVEYNLKKKYNYFKFQLTPGDISGYVSAGIQIYGDDKLIYAMGVSKNTSRIPVSLSVKGMSRLTILVHTTLEWASEVNIILNNAYLTSTTIDPASVKLNVTKKTIKIGKSYQLKATVKPSNAYKKYTWTSSNKLVAKVSSSGKVVAKKAGKATITVRTQNGKKATCRITVPPKRKK